MRASLIGQTISHYRIVEELGSGGMGSVWKAEDVHMRRVVALKFLHLSEDLPRLLREAQTAGSLNHPNLCTVYQVDPERRFIAMEYVEGKTLSRMIGGRPLPAEEALGLSLQIGEGLKAAHHKGITHRDIKSGNIVVTERGQAKILDFGLARVVGQDRLTHEGAVAGTPGYMAPEQLRGDPVDHRTDIWAYGAVIHEMLTGRLPVASVGVLPAGIDFIVRKSLADDPAERYQHIDDMLVDMKRAYTPGEDEVRESHAPAGLRRHRRRTRAGVAASIMLAALAAWWLWETDYFWRNPLADARTERLTDFEGYESDAAISPDGKFVVFRSDRDGQDGIWFSQIGSGEFVNLTKGQFVTGVAGSSRDPIRRVGFFGDGPQIWISQGQGAGPYSLWLASPMGGVPRLFHAGMVEPAWSPDGTRIVYHTADPGDPIFIADRTGGNPRQILIETPDLHHHYPIWSPDSRFIYFVKGTPTTERTDIWRIPVAVSGVPAKPERITHHNARVGSLAWLDTRTLVYSATAENGAGQWLYALDVRRRRHHRVSSGITEQYLSVAASATHPRRLVASVAAPRASLWAIPVSDRPQTETALSRFQIPNTRARAPRFSSGYLLFLSSTGGGDGLWKLEHGATRELWRGSEGELAAPPAISSDGGQICFSYRKEGRAGLYVMDASGANIRALAPTLDVRGAASWSPDGKWVAVAANDEKGTHVFKVPAGGGDPVRLVDTPSHHPLWSPDSTFIMYAQPLQGGTLTAKAITADKKPVELPKIEISYTTLTPYRFVGNAKAVIVLEGGSIGTQNFSWLDLVTGARRRLTDFKPGMPIENFDVTPDGKQIVFDRLRENSDIVIIDMAR